ncbi:hypothetical protein PRIC2_006425 [Phytophthora ramorum]
MLNLFQYLEMAENPGVLSNQMLVLMVVEDGVKYKNHLCKYGKLYLTEMTAHGKPLHCMTARKRSSSCTRRTATRCGSRHCIYHTSWGDVCFFLTRKTSIPIDTLFLLEYVSLTALA